MGVDLNAWATSFMARVNEKVAHTNQMIEQKLEYQQKFLEQRLANIGETNAEKLLGFSTKLEEALAEIRGFKDILQQQLTLLDNTTKRGHGRTDEIEKRLVQVEKLLEGLPNKTEADLVRVKEEFTKEITGIRSIVEKQYGDLTELEGNLKKIQDMEREEEIVKTTRQNDPIRRFLTENGTKLLVFVLVGIGLFLLRNLDGLLKLFQSLGGGG
jgi:hypothetical protein